MKQKLKIFSAVLAILVISAGISYYWNQRRESNNKTAANISNITTEQKIGNEIENSDVKAGEVKKPEESPTIKDEVKVDEKKTTEVTESANTKNEEIIKEETKQQQKRPETVYAEEIVSNFERIYPDVISYSDVDFSMLGTLVDKNMPFYGILKKEVELERSKGTKIKLEGFIVKAIKEVNSKEYKVYVEEKLTIELAGKKTAKNNKWIFSINVDSNVRITNREVWSE